MRFFPTSWNSWFYFFKLQRGRPFSLSAKDALRRNNLKHSDKNVCFYIFPEKWRNSATWGNKNTLRGMKLHWYVTNTATIEMKSQNWKTKNFCCVQTDNCCKCAELVSVSVASSSPSCSHELSLSFWTASLAESWFRRTGKFQIMWFIQAREENNAH